MLHQEQLLRAGGNPITGTDGHRTAGKPEHLGRALQNNRQIKQTPNSVSSKWRLLNNRGHAAPSQGALGAAHGSFDLSGLPGRIYSPVPASGFLSWLPDGLPPSELPLKHVQARSWQSSAARPILPAHPNTTRSSASLPRPCTHRPAGWPIARPMAHRRTAHAIDSATGRAQPASNTSNPHAHGAAPDDIADTGLAARWPASAAIARATTASPTPCAGLANAHPSAHAVAAMALAWPVG